MPLNEIGMGCRAKSKRTSLPCGNPAVTGFPVCRLHGAGNPKKTGRPGGRPPIHGRYSHRYQFTMSDERAKAFDAALQDPQLLSLVPRLAVIDQRFVELLKKLNSREAGVVWRLLQIKTAEADQVLKDKEIPSDEQSERFTALWEDLRGLVEEGVDEYSQWADIRSVAEDMRKMIDTEARRIKLMAEIISMEDAKAFTRRLMEHAQKRMEPVEFNGLVYDLEQDLAGVLGGSRGDTREDQKDEGV